MTIRQFGTMPDGTPVEAIEIAGGGLTARFLTWGAVLQDLIAIGDQSQSVAVVGGFWGLQIQYQKLPPGTHRPAEIGIAYGE